MTGPPNWLRCSCICKSVFCWRRLAMSNFCPEHNFIVKLYYKCRLIYPAMSGRHETESAIIDMRSIWYSLIRVWEEGGGGFNHRLSKFIFSSSPRCCFLCVPATTGRTKKAFQTTGPGLTGQAGLHSRGYQTGTGHSAAHGDLLAPDNQLSASGSPPASRTWPPPPFPFYFAHFLLCS